MIRLKTILASTGRKSGTARRSAGALLMCGVLALTPLVQTAQAATSKAAQFPVMPRFPESVFSPEAMAGESVR